MSEQSRETEYQFDCGDLDAVERWIRAQPPHALLSFRPAATRHLRDTYFDTEDWALNRARFTLRIRTNGDSREATLKSFGQREDGPVSRIEINEPLGESGLEAAGGPVGQRVRLMTAGRPLRPLFDVATDRRAFIIERNGSSLAEISLDDTRISSGGGPSSTLQRVEIEELAAGGLEEARTFIEAMQAACGLTPAQRSKFAAGLAAAGLDPAQTLDTGDEAQEPEATAGEYALASLRRYFRDLRQHEPGTRLGEDPEELHDMRVALRKLRAAMSTFKDVLPLRFQALREELRWLGGSLGTVRDLDVQLGWLEAERERAGWEDATALGPLIAELEQRRQHERARLLGELDSPPFVDLMQGLTAALREAAPGGAKALARVRKYGRKVLRRRYRQLERVIDDINADAPPPLYHAARIRAKRLRYSLDALAPVYGRRAEEVIDELKTVQDLLGEYQDCSVSITWLRETALGGDRDWPPHTLVRAGELMEQRRQRMAEIRLSLPEAFQRLEKRWRQLRRSMRKAASVSDEETPAPPSEPAVQRPLSIFRRFFSRRA